MAAIVFSYEYTAAGPLIAPKDVVPLEIASARHDQVYALSTVGQSLLE